MEQNVQKNRRNKKNNYVVAEKLMLENVSLTKWNQFEFFVSRSNLIYLPIETKIKHKTLITCRDFFLDF